MCFDHMDQNKVSIIFSFWDVSMVFAQVRKHIPFAMSDSEKERLNNNHSTITYVEKKDHSITLIQ